VSPVTGGATLTSKGQCHGYWKHSIWQAIWFTSDQKQNVC